MPRKPARKRDPNRSHAGRKHPSESQNARNGASLCGTGWERFCLSAPTVEALNNALAQTPITALVWHAHPKRDQQVSSAPMQQHQIITSNREVGSMWRNARDRVWHEVGQKACPRCKHSIQEHTHDTSMDINDTALQLRRTPSQHLSCPPLPKKDCPSTSIVRRACGAKVPDMSARKKSRWRGTARGITCASHTAS